LFISKNLKEKFFEVSGEGFAANLLKRILKIFNPIAGGVADDDDWRNCFREPTPPDYSLFQLIFLIYVISLVLCILQVYANRLRRLVASHYWPHRSKPRALYLFNEILEGRKNILSQTVKAAKKRVSCFLCSSVVPYSSHYHAHLIFFLLVFLLLLRRMAN
uniref:Dendritic cell-specific transmembrane protein-like domain-containing protein n=1 Tax=Parascaris equorum TaxID=6256 RepID=A0A914S2I4_PAREQ